MNNQHSRLTLNAKKDVCDDAAMPARSHQPNGATGSRQLNQHSAKTEQPRLASRASVDDAVLTIASDREKEQTS